MIHSVRLENGQFVVSLFVAGMSAIAAACLAIALPPPSTSFLIGATAITFGAIGVLCRIRMPTTVRASIIVGLIVILLALAAKSDPFGMKAVKAATEKAQADRPVQPETTMAAAPELKDTKTPRSGARVALRRGEDGDGGWAEQINDAIDGTLGGSKGATLTIEGRVTADTASNRLAITWWISNDASDAQCGTTSLFGTDPAIAIAQIAASFRRAIDRSIAMKQAACY